MVVPSVPVRRLRHVAPQIVPATDLGGTSVLKQGRTFLITDAWGDVSPDARGLGLYAGDTRILSCLVLRVNGQRPSVLRADPGGAASGTIELTNPELRRVPRDKALPGASLARLSLGITRHRRISGGLHERLVIANYSGLPATIDVDLLLDVDMADIFEVQGHVRPRRGVLGPIEVRASEADFPYAGLDGLDRVTRVSAPGAAISPARRGTRAALAARWQRDVEAGDRITLEWSIRADMPGTTNAPADLASGDRAAGDVATRDHAPGDRTSGEPASGTGDDAGEHASAVGAGTAMRSDRGLFDRVIARSVADLALLVTPGPGPGQRHLAAGLPWFATLFGRDAIIASYGALLVDRSLAVDTLRVLAGLQATADDPTRDAEPGKIAHEIRDGEMARTGELPFGRYYGASDTTPLWLILLGETYDWTGDVALVRELWPNVLAALGWIEHHGDLDGDGFIEYRRRAPSGLVNQGWKDAADSIRARDGRIAEGPIALAEVQGYAYDARVRIARLARAVGDVPLAGRLEVDAERLRARFDQAFWVPDRATYALALDGGKRPMDAIGSNQGHALWSGIVADEHARAVADRLAGPDLDSGWGIRTFAAGQPGYTPLGYHTGAVWPHDTAIAIAGLRRHGFDAEAARLAGELFAAAQEFPDERLPELFCGFGSDEVEVPVPYPVACSPQAWAAAAPLLVLRSMLGIRPRAHEHVLELERPHLPEGLGSLTVSGMRIGDARVDLLFHRWRGATSVEVLRRVGDLAVTIRI